MKSGRRPPLFRHSLEPFRPAGRPTGWLLEGRAMVKRFVVSSVVFVGLVVPGAILIALLVAR
jgi:hypothetical protein